MGTGTGWSGKQGILRPVVEDVDEEEEADGACVDDEDKLGAAEFDCDC